MPLIAGLVGLLGRFAGRFLNTTLGWATILLFGKVSGRRQSLLLLMVLGALAWVAFVVGVIVPEAGTLLVAAVPLPDFVDEGWVRLGMLIGALVMPALIGLAAMFVSGQHPTMRTIATTAARGYAFTLALALTIATLAAVSTVRKLQSLSRRWEAAHVPVIVKPGGYDELLVRLVGVLKAAGLRPTLRPAPALVSAPPRLLDRTAGRALGKLVPDRLMLIVGEQLEILVYPSDLAISGSSANLARARAAVASALTDAPAYLTTSAEAQALEDKIGDLAVGEGRSPVAVASLAVIDHRLARLTVPFDEWETLYRQRLQRERDMLRGSAAPPGVEAVEPAPARLRAVDLAIALGGVGLVALDVALLIADRAAPSRRSS